MLFPLNNIFGDVLTEVYGFKRSRGVMWAGFGASALLAGVLWLLGKMPGEANWMQFAGQRSYDLILGGVASGGTIIASLVAHFSGEYSNSFVLAKMKIMTNGRYL